MKNIVVVSNKNDLEFLEQANFKVVDVDEYLSKDYFEQKSLRVFNLCRDYSYCKKGYYVSLLAEARGHRPTPSVSSIMDMNTKISRYIADENFDDLMQKTLKPIKALEFKLSIYFGKNLSERYTPLARTLFHFFKAPLLRAFFVKDKGVWRLDEVGTISLNEVPKTHSKFLISSMNDYFRGNYVSGTKRKQLKYDVAILVNPTEKMPPSDTKAIKKFVEAGEKLRIHCEVIEPKDISWLPRFDGLFIRETTNVHDHTYRFAHRAQSEGLIVIDDPLSIIRCCNKIYLHDLLMKKKIPVPKTQIISKSQLTNPGAIDLKFPVVIKKPDSSFSAGVKKINNRDDFMKIAEEFFKTSDLLVLQEFLVSEYDWRVGLIDGEPLYVCKYYMAKNHWQIINHDSKKEKEGETATLDISEVPEQLLKIAKKACDPIGNSLYGVDIKQVNDQFYVIEVNDNPNIVRGDEDKVLGEALYLKVMSSFLRRMEMR